MNKLDKDPQHKDELPPFFSSWKGAYIFLMANLFLLIFLFYLFTRFFE